MRLGLIVAVGVCLASSLSAGTLEASASPPPPSHSIVVTGTGVTPSSTWPAYDPGIDRYAVATTADTGGSLTVAASTTDSAGVVRVDGRVATGPVTVNGLASGDEVNVQILDSGGSSNQSFVYLPPGYPRMNATSSGSGPTPGYVFLTTTSVFPSARYETVVDRNGVPVYVHEDVNPMDLKLQPNGHYSVARGHDNTLASTFDIVELNNRFEPIASYTNPPPLQNTEFHDSILLPSGGRILMAYEPAASPSTDIDSVVQEVKPDGSLGLTWNSADHTQAGDRLTPLQDYAHMNSMEVMQDGNLLLSFRHLSQVMKVDRVTGDVLWRLGGTRSDFTFPNDPYGGPCAQHTARELSNGDIQVWDNGSRVGPFTLTPMCPDGPDAGTALDERPFSRVVTYHLDETAHTATIVQSFTPGHSFSEFAGSAQRLGAGTLADNVFIGMADSHDPDTNAERPDALEVDKDGNVVWTLDIPGFFSYRAQKFPAPDAIAPQLTVSGVTDGATYAASAAPTLSYGCTDRGGSNLDTCTGTVASGTAVPMAPGAHTLTVSATDRAGNTTTRTIAYTALAGTATAPTASARPDLRLRKAGGPWVGTGRTGSARKQTIQVRLGDHSAGRKQTIRVRLKNVGTLADRFTIAGSTGSAQFRVRYLLDGVDRTGKVTTTWLSPRLAPGESLDVALRVVRRPAAATGDKHKVKVVAAAKHDPAVDGVAAVLKAR